MTALPLHRPSRFDTSSTTCTSRQTRPPREARSWRARRAATKRSRRSRPSGRGRRPAGRRLLVAYWSATSSAPVGRRTSACSAGWAGTRRPGPPSSFAAAWSARSRAGCVTPTRSDIFLSLRRGCFADYEPLTKRGRPHRRQEGGPPDRHQEASVPAPPPPRMDEGDASARAGHLHVRTNDVDAELDPRRRADVSVIGRRIPVAPLLTDCPRPISNRNQSPISVAAAHRSRS
jgi:hypothetical protein